MLTTPSILNPKLKQASAGVTPNFSQVIQNSTPNCVKHLPSGSNDRPAPYFPVESKNFKKNFENTRFAGFFLRPGFTNRGYGRTNILLFGNFAILGGG